MKKIVKIPEITETEHKLKEAKYFLSLMRRGRKKAEQFDYLLNAFVSSARSVTWVMKAEFSKIDGWKSWYEGKKVDKSEEEILKLFNELRVGSTKRQSLRTHFLVELKVPKEVMSKSLNHRLNRLKRKKLIITLSKNRGRSVRLDSKKISFPAYLTSARRAVIGFSDKDVLGLCLGYVDILKGLVGECMQQFGQHASKPKDPNIMIRY